MSKKDEVFRRYEKLSRAAKRENPGSASEHKPGSCAHCLYYRPDFKYRRCQFTRCPYGKDKTDIINTEYSDTDSFYSGRSVGKGSEAMRIRAHYEEYFRESLDSV